MSFPDTVEKEKALRLADFFGKKRQVNTIGFLMSLPYFRTKYGGILSYLLQYLNQVIHNDELLVVSKNRSYSQRVKELRTNFGWPILSGVVMNQMIEQGDFLLSENITIKQESYLLIENVQDKEAPYRWTLAKDFRKNRTIDKKQKILTFMKENIGIPITGEELRYVANDSPKWAKIVYELRTEEGWKIKTKQTGRPDLPQGVYILEDDKQSEKHDRSIPDPVQIAVLERDNFQCIRCGWSRNKMHADDPRSQLELHHIRPHVMKGENTKENLATLCNVCHDEIHRADKNNTWSVAEFNLWAKSNL